MVTDGKTILLSLLGAITGVIVTVGEGLPVALHKSVTLDPVLATQRNTPFLSTHKVSGESTTAFAGNSDWSKRKSNAIFHSHIIT